jgi:DNA modification methylase
VAMKIRDRVKSLVRVRAGDLLPNPKNWRRHPKMQADALRGILAEVGFADALLARETPAGLMLIDGHLRAETTPDMDVPVLILDLNEAESDKLLLTLDPLAAMAETDSERALALLRAVETDSDAVNALLERTFGAGDWQAGYGEPAADPGAQVDRAAELQAKWGTAAGQAWQIGPHRLVCGDSTDEGLTRRLWGDNSPEMMVTDPPYGVEYDPAWRNVVKRQDGSLVGATATGIVHNDETCDWRAVWAVFPGDVAYVWHSAIHSAEVHDSLTASDFAIRSQIIWAKQQFVIGRGDYHWQHEPCWYAVRKGAVGHWGGDRTQATIWQIDAPSGWRQVTEGPDAHSIHSTQKPIECMARPIRNHDIKTVYDPFCGSGTTLVACEQLGRVGYGVEIDPGYVAVTLERLVGMRLKPELM